MFINEVIREADAISPNEYTIEEKYAWIDELNSIILQEHLRKYSRVEIEPDDDGNYILPDGITFEMVEKIIAQGREIEKYDFRSFGIKPIYTFHERFYIPVHCKQGGAITVIYIVQAEPIRTIKTNGIIGKSIISTTYDFGEYDVDTKESENYIGVYNIGYKLPDIGDTVKFSVSEDCSRVELPYEAYPYNVGNSHIVIDYDFKQGEIYCAKITKQPTYNITHGSHTIYTEVTPAEATVINNAVHWFVKTENSEFREGDSVKITYSDTEKTCTVSSVDYDNDSYIVHINEIIGAEVDTACIIERIVTDETLVPAPYDRMYIDFLLSKMAFYQRNYVVYNQMQKEYYWKMRSYDNWLMKRGIKDNDGQFRNWF